MNAPAAAPVKNAVALASVQIPSLNMDEGELIRVLQNSIYPGAKVESIKLVLGYCRANVLDPMTKPVHIVPMKVKVKGDGGQDRYEDRDVVMPGIELYRIKAARTGDYMGISEPVFGPPETITFKEKKWVDMGDNQRSQKWVEGTVTYPAWCKIVVRRRMEDGETAEFPAIEFWTENYATKGRDSDAPNDMWQKRPFGQLAKCAEAQALRKAFPELGAAPTAEEMQGKTIDETGAPVHEGPAATAAVQIPQERKPSTAPEGGVKDAEVVGATSRASTTEASGEGKAVAGELMPREEKKKAPLPPDTSGPASASQMGLIRKKAEQATVTEAEICKKYNLEKLDGITADMGNVILAWLRDPAGD